MTTRHHKFLIPNAEVLERLPEAVDHMAEPMVGQDAVAFYLLAERVSQARQGGAERAGRRRGVRRLFLVSADAGGHGSDLERFRALYFDRDHEEFCRRR